jgi:hypothetical protein
LIPLSNIKIADTVSEVEDLLSFLNLILCNNPRPLPCAVLRKPLSEVLQ